MQQIFHSEIGTYSCGYSLDWNGHPLLQANGKGETEIYAKASCYAELYERFCYHSLIWEINNYFLIRAQHQENFKNHKWFDSPHEKFLTNQELIDDEYCKDFLMNLLPDLSDDTINQFREIFNENFSYGNEYYSLYDNNDIKYKSARLISLWLGTTGCSAGNTLQEALIQAVSELYERFAIQELYQKPIQNKYYYINPKNLNPKFQNYIKFLEDNYNFEARVYDLSYNYQVPTAMLLLIDRTRHRFFMHYGANPVFDIAVERCFTEIYQGHNTLPDHIKYYGRTKDIGYEDICYHIFQSAVSYNYRIIPEPFIFNSEMIDSYNTEFFLPNKEYNNEYLLDWVRIIGIKHDFQIYWTNMSMSNDMYAVYVMFDKHMLCGYGRFDWINHLTREQRFKVMTITKYVYQCIDLVIHQRVTEDDVEIFCKKLIELLDWLGAESLDEAFDIIISFIDCDAFNVFTYVRQMINMDDYRLLKYIICNDFHKENLTDAMTLQKDFQAYMLYLKYKDDNYPPEQMKQIFDFLGFEDFDVTKEITPLYLIWKLFAERLYNIYNSKEFKEFIEITTPD